MSSTVSSSSLTASIYVSKPIILRRRCHRQNRNPATAAETRKLRRFSTLSIESALISGSFRCKYLRAPGCIGNSFPSSAPLGLSEGSRAAAEFALENHAHQSFDRGARRIAICHDQ